MARCSQDLDFDGYYFEFAISIPIFIILQSFLLHHSIRQQRKLNGDTSKKSHLLYILMQICALSWTILELFRLVIDPATHIFGDNIICSISAYLPKLLPAIFYALYLYQITLRLEAFKDSYLKVGKTTTRLIKLFVLFPILIGNGSLYFVNGQSVCRATWNPQDLQGIATDYSFCELPISSTGIWLCVYAFMHVLSYSIILAVLFCVKLHKLMNHHKENEKVRFKFKSLIVKNSILTITGCISTLLNYMLWIGYTLGIGAVFLYIDLFINSLVIGLMFTYNEGLYRKLCKCCILFCFRRCDHGQNGKTEDRVMAYINNGDLNLSSRRVTGTIPTPIRTKSASTLTGSPVSIARTNTDTSVNTVMDTPISITASDGTKFEHENVDVPAAEIIVSVAALADGDGDNNDPEIDIADVEMDIVE